MLKTAQLSRREPYSGMVGQGTAAESPGKTWLGKRNLAVPRELPPRGNAGRDRWYRSTPVALPRIALRESETWFALLMDYLPGVALLKDLNGRYVYVSPGFVKLTGRATGLCLGSSDEEYWPESAERLRAEDQSVIRTGHALTGEDACTFGNETRYYRTVKFPIPDKNGATKLVTGISLDITGAKVAEQRS